MTNRKDARVSSDFLREALDRPSAEIGDLRAEVRVLSRLVAATDPIPTRQEAEDTPDLLYGMPSIAAHLGLTEAQGYHLHANRTLPTFNIGRRVCARRSDLDAWLQAGRAGGLQ